MKRLRLVGALIMIAWLLALGWLVWRQRHPVTVAPRASSPSAVTLGWHARCTLS